MDFEKHATWFLFPFISYITVNGVFYAPDCWYLCQCRLFFSWPAKIIKTNILEVLVGFFDGLPETFNMVFDLIQFLQYCEWGFLCTCSLVVLPVSTVFQLASQDYEKTDIFEVLICFFDGLPETSNMVFDIIHFMQYCEWGFLCTCSLVVLPVSTVFQLASQDYRN